MKAIFKTKRGRLTRYALACGYVERSPVKTRADVMLCMPSPSTGFYSVFHWHEGREPRTEANFKRLKEARQYFNKVARGCKNDKA